jgi:hypothetical protein
MVRVCVAAVPGSGKCRLPPLALYLSSSSLPPFLSLPVSFLPQFTFNLSRCATLLRVPSFPREPPRCPLIPPWIPTGGPDSSKVSTLKSWSWATVVGLISSLSRCHPQYFQGVGKTSLLQRYTQNKFDPKNTTSTTGAFFVAKKVTVNGVKVRLQLWDTAGQERFRSMVCTFPVAHPLIAICAHRHDHTRSNMLGPTGTYVLSRRKRRTIVVRYHEPNLVPRRPWMAQRCVSTRTPS